MNVDCQTTPGDNYFFYCEKSMLIFNENDGNGKLLLLLLLLKLADGLITIQQINICPTFAQN